MLFAQEQEFTARDPEAAEARDPDDPRFWNAVAERFAAVRQMIEDDCRERGIDLTMTDEQKQAIDDAEDRRHRKTEADPLSESSLRYTTSAGDWFKSHKQLFEDKAHQLAADAEMELPGARPAAEAADLVHAVQIK